MYLSLRVSPLVRDSDRVSLDSWNKSRRISRNRCEPVFSSPLPRLSVRRVNSICSDKQRPSMALIPCNWGWITICSPTLHKGVYSSTVFERVEWTRQSVSVRVAGVFYLTTIFWFLKSGFSAFYYIRIYRSTLPLETVFQSNPSSKHVSRSISKADTIFIVGLSRLIISDSYILIGTAL